MNQKGGIFDQKIGSGNIPMRSDNKPATITNLQKEDFKSVEDQASGMMLKAKTISKEALVKTSEQEAIDKINNAVGETSVKETEEALQELSTITEEDLKLAEAMIFQGYSEKTIPIPNFKDHTITVCTTSPEEIDIVDEMLFDMIKQSENKDNNTVDLSDAVVRSSRNMYNLSLGYKGMDKNDVHTDRTCQLDIIKKAIESLYRYEESGDIKGMKEMKEDIKKAIRKRSYMLKKLPTPMIDFISQTKYEFDQKMFNVMNTKNILSKF